MGEVTNHDRAAGGAQHVNEQHHLVCGLAVLNTPRCNFLEHFSHSDRSQFEDLVSALVLGTDAADDRHWREQFQQVLDASPKSSFEASSYEQAVLGLRIMLKCADLGHLATPWAEHCKWVDRLEQEFFAQGDQEKDLGFEEISFLMDREVSGVSQNQSGFFDFVASPLFHTLVKAFPNAQPMLCAVEANSDRWLKIERQKTLAETPHCIIHNFQFGICVCASNRLQRHRKCLQATGCKRVSMNLCKALHGWRDNSEEQSGLLADVQGSTKTRCG